MLSLFMCEIGSTCHPCVYMTKMLPRGCMYVLYIST